MGANKTFNPLSSDLSSLSGEDLKQAVDVRADRINELGDLVDTDHVFTAGDVREMKQLRADLERLEEFKNAPLPHPGHPRPRGEGTSRRKTGGGEYGLVEGLGAEFVKQMGGMKAFDGTGGGGTMPFSWFDTRLRELPQRQLLVRSLIPTTRVTSDKVGYVRQTVFTNAATAVAAHGDKPVTTITAERAETPITVIAHVTEALDRSLLSDYDALVGFVDNQLRLGVLMAEEDEILNGSGSAPHLRGILQTSGIQTQAKGAGPTPDAIHKAMTKVRNVFLEPDALVIHPNDWEQIALLTNADGVYLFGSPANEAAPQIWGKRVVITPVIAEGTALVGAFGVAAEVYEREGARVEFASTGIADTADKDMFQRNEIRYRAESRIGLAVFRPTAFCTVTGV